MTKHLDVESIQDKMEAEGFDYYMEHYAPSDLGGTPLETLLTAYQKARRDLLHALEDAGVDVDVASY